MTKIIRYIPILILYLIPSTLICQTIKTENDSLAAINLPPIEVLFEGAKKSASYKYYETRLDAEKKILRSERRRWLGYINMVGTYQYGVMGMNTYNNEGVGSPIIQQYSGSNQMWYNFGVSVRIPLDGVYDRKNRIHIQKDRINEAEYSKEQWFDSYKTKIIEYYSKAQEMLNTLGYCIQQATLSDAQYDVATKDYIVGQSTAQSLNVAKSQQVQAQMQLARVKSELVNSLLQLELLTNVNLLF